MLHHQSGFDSFVFGSTSITIIVSFSKRKEKKLPTKCLLLKWDYIPLSLIELALQINFLVLSPCSLNTISSIKPYHEEKLISRFQHNPEIFKKV